MNNQMITIEVRLQDTSTMFAVNKIIGFRDFVMDDDFNCEINVDNASLIFRTNLKGMEDVARIITGIETLGLAKTETETKED